MIEILSPLFILIGVYTLLALISLRIKTFAIVDFMWGPAVLISILSHYYFQHEGLQFNLLFILIALWCLRLSILIGKRISLHGDDPRYLDFVKNKSKIVIFLSVFMFQAVWAFGLGFVAWPMADMTLTLLSYIGLALAVLGLGIETRADIELFKFKNTVRKGVCNVGLWKKARHPNYFGELLFWWGIYISTFGMNLNSAIALIGPVLITVLINNISGVPLKEKRLRDKFDNEEGWTKFRRETNKYLPL